MTRNSTDTVVVVAAPTREAGADAAGPGTTDTVLTSYDDLTRDLPGDPARVIVLDGEGAEHAVSALAHHVRTGLPVLLEIGGSAGSRERLEQLGRLLPDLGVVGVETWRERSLVALGWGEGLRGPGLAQLVELRDHRPVAGTAPTSSARPAAPPRAPSAPGLGQRARRLLPLAALLGLAAVVVLVLVGVLAGSTALLVLLALGVAVLQVGTLAVVAVLWRDVRGVRADTRELGGVVRRRTKRLLDQGGRSRRRDAAAARRLDVIDRRTTLVVTEQRRRFSRLAAEDRQLHLTTRRQQQAWDNLGELVDLSAAVPPAGGWAASPDVVLCLVDRLLERRPALVVECGSGVSTLFLALAAEQHGLPTRIVSLEHLEEYAEGTRALLARHGVAHRAEIRLAPLGPSSVPGHDTAWYAESAVADLAEIGLLFVDGPPEATGPMVRYPAVPLLRDRFAADCTIVLDDAVRDDEREAERRWAEELPDFTLDHVREYDKHASVLSRRG